MASQTSSNRERSCYTRQRFSSRSLSIFAILLALISALVWYLDAHLESFYIFEPAHLHDLAQRAIAVHGNDTRSVVNYVVQELDQKLSRDHLNLHEEWVFNNAGGAMGAMYIIHASITEYLIVFGLFNWAPIPSLVCVFLIDITAGTAIGTEGHTGRHTADDYFHILQGTQLAYTPGSYEAEIYPPGSVHHLPRGEVKQYKMEGSCFALEYARGWIPPMIAFGFADTFTSTLDFPTLWATTRITAREMILNLLKGKF